MRDPDLVGLGVKDDAMVVSKGSKGLSCRDDIYREMGSNFCYRWRTLRAEKGRDDKVMEAGMVHCRWAPVGGVGGFGCSKDVVVRTIRQISYQLYVSGDEDLAV